MHYEELVELNTMGRELDEEEKKMLKRDALDKTISGFILVLVAAIVVGLLALILPNIPLGEIELSGKSTRKIFTFLFVGIGAFAVYVLGTLKHALTAFPLIKDAKVVEVTEVNFKALDKAGYKHYGEVKVRINGVVEQLEVPIMRDSVKMVKWQRKGKLYFVPGKYYMLGNIDG